MGEGCAAYKRGRGVPQTTACAGSWRLAAPRSRWTTGQVTHAEGDGQEEELPEDAVVLNTGTTDDATVPHGAEENKTAEKPEAKPADAKERRSGGPYCQSLYGKNEAEHTNAWDGELPNSIRSVMTSEVRERD